MLKKVWEDFRTKNLREYHELYIRSDTLLWADVFLSFSSKWIEMYKLDPVYFLLAPGLAQQTSLKNTEVELELLTNVNMHHGRERHHR